VASHRATSAFAGFRFPPEVISLAVRWYLRYGLSYPDVEELLAERGITVDHVTVYRWVQRFTEEFIEAARPCRHAPGDRWFVDETTSRLPGDGLISTGRSISMARSSTSCCQPGGIWPQPGASLPGRCSPARSRSRSRRTVRLPARGSLTSWFPRPCTLLSSMRTIRSRRTMGGCGRCAGSSVSVPPGCQARPRLGQGGLDLAGRGAG
jgi:hypothetical protein